MAFSSVAKFDVTSSQNLSATPGLISSRLIVMESKGDVLTLMMEARAANCVFGSLSSFLSLPVVKRSLSIASQDLSKSA